MADVRIDLAEIREESESGARLDMPAPRRWHWRVVAAVAGTVIVIAATWLLRPHQEDERPELRIVPLTSLNGEEYSPTFSPDGDRVAFVWNGEKKDNFDIYVKIVGSSEVRRLTTDPEPDLAQAGRRTDGRSRTCVRSQDHSLVAFASCRPWAGLIGRSATYWSRCQSPGLPIVVISLQDALCLIGLTPKRATGFT